MSDAVLNEIGLNFGLLNQGTVPPGASSPPDVSSVRLRPYWLEVRDQDGVWLANVLQWRNGQRRAKANEPESLSLEIPGTDDAAAYLSFPNEVWVYLGDYASVVSKCTIVATTVRKGVGHWVTVECEGLLGQLGRELVTSYETPTSVDADGTTVHEKASVRNILGALLSQMQTQDPPIGLGKFDASVGDTEVAIRFDNKSILQCLRELHAAAGGYYYVDTSRKLQWRRTSGYDLGHWIKFGHNLREIEVRTDYRTIQTELLGFGAGGTPETRLSVTKDDTAAQSTYGVIRGDFYRDNINEQATLDGITEAELARRSGPKVSYRVGVVNLAGIDPTNYNFEAALLNVGTRVGVYVDDLDLAVESTVLAITWDLDNPAGVAIELSDPDAAPTGREGDGSHSTGERKIYDYIADALESAEAAEVDQGKVLALTRSLDPPTDDPADILTKDNVYDTMATDLGNDYGATGYSDVDGFTDALMDRFIDALSNPDNLRYDALRAALGSLGENNIWLPYTGS